MTKDLAARQWAATRREMKRDLKRKDREKLLRESIRSVKRSRRERWPRDAERRGTRTWNAPSSPASDCPRASLRTRERARGLCSVSRGEAHSGTLHKVEKRSTRSMRSAPFNVSSPSGPGLRDTPYPAVELRASGTPRATARWRPPQRPWNARRAGAHATQDQEAFLA